LNARTLLLLKLSRPTTAGGAMIWNVPPFMKAVPPVRLPLVTAARAGVAISAAAAAIANSFIAFSPPGPTLALHSGAAEARCLVLSLHGRVRFA
jgi:hypothetical protein